MRLCSLLVGMLAPGTNAFAPAQLNSRIFFVDPKPMLNGGFVSNGVAVPALTVIAWGKETVPSNELTHLTLRPDKSVFWSRSGGADLCVEASNTSRAMIKFSRCTGKPAQLWKLVPSGSGQRRQIRLVGANECLAVVKQIGLKESSLELRPCDHQEAAAWTFGEAISDQAQGISPLPTPVVWIRSVVHFLVMSGIGVLSLGAWSRQWQRCAVVVNQDRVPLDGDQDGICLTLVTGVQLGNVCLTPTFKMCTENHVAAVMALSNQGVWRPEKGDVVRARRDFYSCGKRSTKVQGGSAGHIYQIDGDGDAIVRFPHTRRLVRVSKKRITSYLSVKAWEKIIRNPQHYSDTLAQESIKGKKEISAVHRKVETAARKVFLSSHVEKAGSRYEHTNIHASDIDLIVFVDGTCKNPMTVHGKRELKRALESEGATVRTRRITLNAKFPSGLEADIVPNKLMLEDGTVETRSKRENAFHNNREAQIAVRILKAQKAQKAIWATNFEIKRAVLNQQSQKKKQTMEQLLRGASKRLSNIERLKASADNVKVMAALNELQKEFPRKSMNEILRAVQRQQGRRKNQSVEQLICETSKSLEN